MRQTNIFVGLIFTFLLFIFAQSVSFATNVDSNIKERYFKAVLENGATGVSIPDTIISDLLTTDGIVIARLFVVPNTETMETNGEIVGTKTIMTLPFKSPGTDFILRLSHPDYADAVYAVQSKGSVTDLGIIKMRKLTSFERSRILEGVTVTASIIQVVNKGDTIQYNADAFAVAKGSMLDALIEKMPGVELRNGSQIYVNGRFVDKLLLDGKDFFKGDQFVLLQNLPAYTVKNLKVYEEASASHEVFGRKSSSDPDLYVMDITLKKGYNSGIMANAEIGGGSHHRYRGRGFGSIYNTSFRLGAFGFLNNLNESRNPGRDGDWSLTDNKAGLTTAKGSGISYGFYRPHKTLEFTGSASAQYVKTEKNTLTNLQNFISEGDTYTRRWDDNLNREISVKTDNTLTLRPKEGHKYNQMFTFGVNYRSGKVKGNTTEATFRHPAGDVPHLRDSLQGGWIVGMDAINRYLTASEANTNKYTARMASITRLSLGSGNDGLSLIGAAGLDCTDNHNPNFNTYLVQYAGNRPTTSLRSNPQAYHSYNYNLAIEWFHPFGAYLNIRPRIDYYWRYDYNRNPWLIETDSLSSASGSMLPSMAVDAMLRLDPQNSYVAGQHSTNIRPWLPIAYEKVSYRDNQPYSSIYAYVDLQANIRRNAINFHGLTDTRAVKNYISPSLGIGTVFNFYKMLHSIQVSYSLEGSSIDAFDLIDNVVFDSDPLYRRIGNPDLTQTMTHSVRAYYSNSNWMFNRLRMYVDLYYFNYRNQKALSYAYDRATGVRTYRPVNVNGNWYGEFVIGPTIALTNNKKLKFVDYFKLLPRRSVDMVSYDDFSSTQKSIVNTMYISESASIEYNERTFMAAVEGQIETQRTTSDNGYFNPFRITTYRYGVRGRVSLPAGFEVSTDLKMYSTRGFDYHEMNTNQLVWNARITKPFMGDKLMLILDGYDILGKVKNISYNVNEQGRTETWVNNIPSYVMLSLRWNFAKKPKE